MKKIYNKALITSIFALFQPIIWIGLFLILEMGRHDIQGDLVEALADGILIGSLFSYILSAISFAILHNQNISNIDFRFKYLTIVLATIGNIPFRILLILSISTLFLSNS